MRSIRIPATSPASANGATQTVPLTNGVRLFLDNKEVKLAEGTVTQFMSPFLRDGLTIENDNHDSQNVIDKDRFRYRLLLSGFKTPDKYKPLEPGFTKESLQSVSFGMSYNKNDWSMPPSDGLKLITLNNNGDRLVGVFEGKLSGTVNESGVAFNPVARLEFNIPYPTQKGTAQVEIDGKVLTHLSKDILVTSSVVPNAFTQLGLTCKWNLDSDLRSLVFTRKDLIPDYGNADSFSIGLYLKPGKDFKSGITPADIKGVGITSVEAKSLGFATTLLLNTDKSGGGVANVSFEDQSGQLVTTLEGDFSRFNPATNQKEPSHVKIRLAIPPLPSGLQQIGYRVLRE